MQKIAKLAEKGKWGKLLKKDVETINTKSAALNSVDRQALFTFSGLVQMAAQNFSGSACRCRVTSFQVINYVLLCAACAKNETLCKL